MYSAKTIADIVAFVEQADPKSILANPLRGAPSKPSAARRSLLTVHSQPIYIAACAFLKDSVLYSSSNPDAPPCTPPRAGAPLGASPRRRRRLVSSSSSSDGREQPRDQGRAPRLGGQPQLPALLPRASPVGALLARRQVHPDRARAKGKGRRQSAALYARGDGKRPSSCPSPSPPSRRQGGAGKLPSERRDIVPPAPGPSAAPTGTPTPSMLGSPADSSQGGLAWPRPSSLTPAAAIGWSLTGTMNSPSTSLAVLYSADSREPYGGATPCSLLPVPHPAASVPPLNAPLPTRCVIINCLPSSPAASPLPRGLPAPDPPEHALARLVAALRGRLFQPHRRRVLAASARSASFRTRHPAHAGVPRPPAAQRRASARRAARPLLCIWVGGSHLLGSQQVEIESREVEITSSSTTIWRHGCIICRTSRCSTPRAAEAAQTHKPSWPHCFVGRASPM